ncbi:hypothetical protein FAVG1_12600 [Fusarium avenaceum]|nr:hypothetical protein FAVG1_12600 [Fusarium avenaceum]
MSTADSHVECTQNIALLYCLGNIGCPPQKNSVRDCEAIRKTSIERTLSFEHEKLLTCTLAFLSSIRDDALKITAVCVEEKEPGLVVMVAANSKDGNGSSDYLDAVKKGYDRICKLLEESPVLSSESLKHQVFSAIIAMCRSRILSRARFTKRGQKQNIDTILGSVKKEMARFTLNDDRREFIKLSQVLISRMEAFRKKLTPDTSTTSILDKQLELIVESFSNISKIPTLGTMLLDETGPRMESDLCRGLLNTINKMAHYQSCAYTLVRLSKRYTLFRNISTVTVKLDSSAFDRPTQKDTRFELTRHVLKLKKDYKTNWDLRDLDQKLAKNTETFWKDFERVTDEPKVHAEIQLIWYLERRQSPIPPRVIASNKDACFLCNAFISFHRRYMTPKTHGRIYPGWKLPSNGLDDTRRLFPKELERMIVENIDVLSRQGLKRAVHPMESTISLAAVSVRSYEDSRRLETLRGTASVVGRNSNTTAATSKSIKSAALISKPTEQSESVMIGVKMKTRGLAARNPKTLLLQRNDSCVDLPETLALEKQLGNKEISKKHDLLSSEQEDHVGHAKVELPQEEVTNNEIYRDQAPPPPTNSHPLNDESGDSTNSWKGVEKDSTKGIKVDSSLHLYIEYAISHPSTSKVLKVRARRLSADEAENDMENLCDLNSLPEKNFELGNCRQVKIRAGKRVYVVDLGEFVGQ